MNFIEAKKKLKAIAKGKCHAIQYEIVEFAEGKVTQRCGVYIEDQSWHMRPTWAEAFESLERELNPPEPKPVKINSIEELETK